MLFLLDIGAVNLFSITISEYLQRKEYFDTLMCIGIEKKSVKKMILKQALILSILISSFTVVIYLILQVLYYKKYVILIV